MEVKRKRSPKVKEETTVAIAGSEEDCDDVPKQLESEVKRSDVQISDSSSSEQNDSSTHKQVFTVFAGERNDSHTNPRSPSLNPKDSEASNEGDQLETTKAEMGEVKEENERLKTILARIMKDYQALQTHFFDVVQQSRNKKPPVENSDAHQETEESELVSLSLGSSSREQKKGEKTAIASEPKEDERMKADLSLGLNSRFDNSEAPSVERPSNSSSENALEEPREEDGAGEPWLPNKSLKMSRSGDDDLSHKVPVKNARVSVRARCDTPTMNDGCQWRKYGQKIAKGNPCPRAYYRCTVAPACPVRKQVQRCADDMSILITTYEGTHNHPLPVSATAMASTTAAAASMLMSGASVSRPAVGVSALATSPTAASNLGLQGLNFGLTDFSRPRQFYLQNPSISSYSSYPTITLDLTSPPSTSSPSLQFKKFPAGRVAPTNLNFSSSEPTANPFLNYGTLPYNKNQVGFFNLGRQPQEAQLHQPFLQKTANSVPLGSAQNPLTSTIAAATKAITSDPSFQSALAVAISSIVGGQGNQGLTDMLGQVNLKWGDQPPPMQPLESSVNVNGCASSYLTRSTSSNSIQQQANHLVFPRPSETIAVSKSGSASPVDNREQMN